MHLLIGCKRLLAYANLYVVNPDEQPRRWPKVIGSVIPSFNGLNVMFGMIVCSLTYDGITSIAIPAHFVLGNMSAMAIFISLMGSTDHIRKMIDHLQSTVDRRKY